jgi:hypothetical protein
MHPRGADARVMTDFARHMEPVARRLLGERNRALSTPDQWRYGTHGSMAVEVVGEKRGTRCAHQRGVGGELIGHEASTGETRLLGDRRRRRLTTKADRL